MVNLLVLTSLDKLLFISKISFTFGTKQDILMRRSIALRLSLQEEFPVTYGPSKISLPVHGFKNALAYFATTISFNHRMFMKLIPCPNDLKHFFICQ